MRYVVLTVAALLALPTLGHAQSALDQLQNLIRPPGDPAPTPAPANPGYLGATLDNLSENVADSGVVVLKVNPEGPAAQAGLVAGDRVVSLETIAVENLDQFARLMRNQVPGSRLKMTVDRDGEPQTILVTLGSRPAAAEMLPPPSNNNPPATGDSSNPLDPLGLEDNSGDNPLPPPTMQPPAQRGKLGVRVVPITDQFREATGTSVRRGAVVESVAPDSAAAFAGIPVGSIIVALNNRRVNDPEDLLSILSTMPPDRDVPINFYVGNRLQQSNVRLDGQLPSRVNELPAGPQPGPFANRPAMQMLNRALSELGANPIPPVEDQTENIQLRNRVAELEAEVARLQSLVNQLQSADGGGNQ